MKNQEKNNQNRIFQWSKGIYFTPNEEFVFKQYTKNFLECCRRKIFEKCPVNDKFFISLQFLQPDVALFKNKRSHCQSIKLLAVYIQCEKCEL